MTCGFLIQPDNWYSAKKKMWFIGVEEEQETSAPPPKKNPGPAPVLDAKGPFGDTVFKNPARYVSMQKRGL